MKKLVCIIVFLAVVGSFTMTFAEEKTESPVIGLSISKNDLVMPDKGDSYWAYKGFIYGLYHNTVGIGTDFCSVPDKKFTEIKPILSLNKGPHFLIIGFKSTSADKENQYSQLGYWYFDSNPKFRLLVDVRNYFDIGGDRSSYFDSSFEYIKWFSRIGIGPTATFDYWWSKNRNYVDVGPIVYYVLIKQPFVAPFVRYQHEWKRWEGSSSQTDYIRLGVYITFK